MAVPAKPPITFKVVNPFVDNNKKTKKIINEINDTVTIGIVLTRFPFPWTAQPKAIKIACGFCAK